MSMYERDIYNEAQALYKQAQAKRDRALRLYEDRLKAEADLVTSVKHEKERLERVKGKQIEDFSKGIENVCKALGDSVKINGMTIEAGLVFDRQTEGHKVKLFTVATSTRPLLLADVFAIAGKGFSWNIKS